MMPVITVTTNASVAVRPAASVAVQLTVVVPTANSVLDAGVHTMSTEALPASVADVANSTKAPELDWAETVKSSGTDNSGGVESTIETMNEFVAMFPVSSVAEQLGCQESMISPEIHFRTKNQF